MKLSVSEVAFNLLPKKTFSEKDTELNSALVWQLELHGAKMSSLSCGSYFHSNCSLGGFPYCNG